MKLIVGLGNPGKEYEQTRHNIGFLVLDNLAGNVAWKTEKKINAKLFKLEIEGEDAILLKPQTFMNRSGESVRAAADYFKIPLENIWVVHDDADLQSRKIKVQMGRSGAGHNGVQSIIDQFHGDTNFHRVRIGIGRSENDRIPLDAWVLGRWSKDEKKALPELIKKANSKLLFSINSQPSHV